MKLTDLLSDALILPDLKAQDAFGTIDTLLDLLIARGQLAAEERERVRDIVHERERSMSTGIGHGVAIPHGVIPGLDGVLGALGRSQGGIDFNAIDHQPVHIAVLVLVGESAHRQHIRTLAIVSRLMNSAALRQHLLRAQSAAEMYRLIRAEESGEPSSLHAL